MKKRQKIERSLINTAEYGTKVLVITPDFRRSLHPYGIQVRRDGRAVYIDAVTCDELFPGHFFEWAGWFEFGYALVVQRRQYFHINLQGRAAYRWRFSDVGDLSPDGIMLVQHPRAMGWSRFHIPSGMFLSNPPRYVR